MARLDDLIAAKDQLSASLLRPRKRSLAVTAARTVKQTRIVVGRNLHAVGVGYKLVEGEKTRTLCVRLYVVQKLPPSLVPREARLPKTIAGLPTDVIESPVASIHAPACTHKRRKRQRPLFTGGISAANRAVAAKTTLGCFCHSTVSGEAGRLYMLSCNHAFANSNAGAIGDAILQRCAGDGGTLADRVGRLTRWVPLQFGGAPNQVDAAIAKVASPASASKKNCMIGRLTGVAPAKLGMIVCKHGRTTGYTEGEVVDIAHDPIVIGYAAGSATFVDQIRVDPTRGYKAPPSEMQWDGWFAAPGDSGSVLVEKGTRMAVGMHFSGAYGISLANHMTNVCSLLNIAIP